MMTALSSQSKLLSQTRRRRSHGISLLFFSVTSFGYAKHLDSPHMRIEELLYNLNSMPQEPTRDKAALLSSEYQYSTEMSFFVCKHCKEPDHEAWVPGFGYVVCQRPSAPDPQPFISQANSNVVSLFFENDPRRVRYTTSRSGSGSIPCRCPRATRCVRKHVGHAR